MTDYIVVVAAGLSPSPTAFVNINSPYIPEPGFIIPMNREGDGLQWAGKLRTVYIDGDVTMEAEEFANEQV